MSNNGEADENSNPKMSESLLKCRKSSAMDSKEPTTCAGIKSNVAKLFEDDEELLENISVFRQIALVKVKNQAQELKKLVVNQMECNITHMMEEFLSELESVKLPQKYRVFVGDSSPKKQRDKKKLPCGSLPPKEFIARSSLLTDLFQVNHIQTIYHIFVAILILLFMNTIIEDIFDRGHIDLDFKLIQWAFGNLETVLITWVGMKFSTLAILYPAYFCWSNHRSLKHHRKRMMWDYSWLFAYIFYLGVFIYLPVKVTVVNKLPPASAFALLMEQVRILMKTHAFVRSNVPASLIFSSHQPPNEERVDSTVNIETDGPCPDFSKYLYFMFAPTLVYRNHYPRTRSIRWKLVFWNFVEVVGVLFYLHFIFVRFCVPVFRRIGQEPLSAKALVLSVFGCMLPGTLVLLCGFFALLHSWLNAFAEMLRFADRMFYEDWWNASTYATYYRTWNVVVHDWLYTYVYKEVHELSGKRNRIIPMLVVFGVSSLFHEYIISFTFRCFYPILLLMFGGFGLVFAFFTNVERRFGNIFMWLTLFIGTGLFMSLYSMEWYARINCPPFVDGFWDIIVPRSWTCINLDRK